MCGMGMDACVCITYSAENATPEIRHIENFKFFGTNSN